MTVSIEESGSVWTVIHSRPKARNARDPDCAFWHPTTLMPEIAAVRPAVQS